MLHLNRVRVGGLEAWVLLLSISLAGVLSGCMSTAQFQGVDTVPKGEIEYGVGASYVRYEVASLRAPDGLETRRYLVPSFFLRRGLFKGVEFHVSGSLTAWFSHGMKFQLLGGREKNGLALSLGWDFHHYYTFTPEGYSSPATTTSHTDLVAPVYLGYRFDPDTALYVTPKYVLRSRLQDFVGITHAAGATAGAEFGHDKRFFVEGGLLRDWSLKSYIPNFGVGMSF